MTIAVTLAASTIQDPNTHFDVTIDGQIVATIERALTNANLKAMITVAYAKGASDTAAATRFDSFLDDA